MTTVPEQDGQLDTVSIAADIVAAYVWCSALDLV